MSFVELTPFAAGIYGLVFNDPSRRNAMGLEMAADFQRAVARLRQDSSIRAVIITGGGSCFSAGGDLEMLLAKAEQSKEQNKSDMLSFYNAFLCVLNLDVPVIAAVNGHAIGAGACLAMACDYRVIADDARLGFTFTRLGLHPGMGATLTLPRLVGTGVAIDLLLSGRIIAGREAAAMGLVNAAVPAAGVREAAVTYASELLGCGSLAIRGLLRTLRPDQAAWQAALAREAAEQAENYATAEFLEGIHAALERRPPRFTD